MSSSKFLILNLLILTFCPSQLEREWIETIASQFELETKHSRKASLAGTLVLAAHCTVYLDPTFVLRFLQILQSDLSEYREKEVCIE